MKERRHLQGRRESDRLTTATLLFVHSIVFLLRSTVENNHKLRHKAYGDSWEECTLSACKKVSSFFKSFINGKKIPRVDFDL